MRANKNGVNKDQKEFQIPEENPLGMMVALFVIGAFIPRPFLRTAGVFCAESL